MKIFLKYYFFVRYLTGAGLLYLSVLSHGN